MFTLPKRAQSFSEIFLNAFYFWRTHFWQLTLLALLSIAVGLIPSLHIPDYRENHVQLTLEFMENHIWQLVILTIILLYLFSVLLYRAYMLLHQLPGHTGIAFGVALKRLPYLLIAFIIFDVAIVFGLILFLIPGIVVMILLSLYFVIVIVEKGNPFSAFKRSWLLITRQFWHVFAVMLGLLLLIALVILFVSGVTHEVGFIDHPIGDGELHLGWHFLRIISGLLLYPYYCSVLLVLFEDLKLRQQNEN